MNLKESEEGDMGGFRGGKRREKCSNLIIISKLKIIRKFKNPFPKTVLTFSYFA